MKERPNQPIWDIEATIVCERDSHKGIIIGKGGAMLKKIGSAARYEIERMLDAKVNLRLWVKVKKDWRDSDFLIKNFGYDKKKYSFDPLRGFYEHTEPKKRRQKDGQLGSICTHRRYTGLSGFTE